MPPCILLHGRDMEIRATQVRIAQSRTGYLRWMQMKEFQKDLPVQLKKLAILRHKWFMDAGGEIIMVKKYCIMANGVTIPFTGYIIKNLQEFRVKLEQYADLQARNFYEQGKRASFFKRFFSPAVNFMSGYVLKLGFLDGYAGFEIAKMNAHYTWLKYNLLYNMYKR